MEFKEKLKERRAWEESEKTKANSSSEVNDVSSASSEKHSEEAIDGNAKNQPEKTDALEDRPDHSQMNGEFETLTKNGDHATTAPDDGKSSVLSIKSQSESKEIITVTGAEPALMNGECKTVEVMLVQKETPKN